MLAVTGVLVVGYGLMQTRVVDASGQRIPSNQAATSNSVDEGADPAPSNADIQTLTQTLGNVTGLYDMAVLPDGLGDRAFVVSAMVDVSDANGGVPSSTTAKTEMSTLVDTYFRDVYSVHMPISEAEITFTEDGTMVGSAGLGEQAYHSMSTSTMNGDLASALLSSPMQTQNSPTESWIELNPEADVVQ